MGDKATLTSSPVPAMELQPTSRFLQFLEEAKPQVSATPGTTDTYSDSVMYLTTATAKAIAGNQASGDIAQARLKCIAATAQDLLQVEDMDAMRIGLSVMVNFASKSVEALRPMPRGVRKVIEKYLDDKGLKSVSSKLNPLNQYNGNLRKSHKHLQTLRNYHMHNYCQNSKIRW